jgi:hypothetical protein
MKKQRVYRLLAICARAECDATHYEQLAEEAAELKDWEGIAAQAEAHGMAPLLYAHLKGAGVEVPLALKRELQGLYARHRHANQVRTRVLRDIVAAYQTADLPALVLKGAALSHLVYPEPGLRPMSDVDILVPRSDVWRAEQILAELGFDTSQPAGPVLPHRHLPAATLRSQGLSIDVEIHHQLLSDYFDNAISYVVSMLPPIVRPIAGGKKYDRQQAPSDTAPEARNGWADPGQAELDGLTGPPLRFAVMDLTAFTFGYEDMLGYLCQHLVSHVNVWDYGRLIWVADIVSFAERFAPEIDWEWIQVHNLSVLNTLSLLHTMTPLSDELLSVAPVKIGHAPQGVGVEYQGWPRARLAHWPEMGYRRALCHTLLPSEWWLRLRYKLGGDNPLFWYRWLRHPLHILGHVVRVSLERLGWPTPGELAEGRGPR